MEKQIKKNQWVCISPTGVIDYTSISCLKSLSIKYFLEGTNETWDVYRKDYGWRCIKVNITFEPAIKANV